MKINQYEYSVVSAVVILLAVFYSDFALASLNILRGDSDYSKGNIGQAMKYYQIELRDKPDSVVARTRLVKCYMRKGYSESVKKLLNEALALDPKNRDALLLKSRSYLHQNKLGKAEGMLNKILQASPDDLDALAELSIVYNNRGDMEAADNLYERMKKINDRK